MTSSGCSLFSYWMMPERLIHEQLGDYYRENPIGSRLFATPVALLSGMVKIFLFPLICAVGVIALPIIALVRYSQEKKETGAWLTAWAFSLLGVAASAAFIGAVTFHLPLVASAGLIILLLAASITYHVYYLVKEPPVA